MPRFSISFLFLTLVACLFLPVSAGAFELMSPAFNDGGKIPARFARPGAGGQNVSPPLKWSGAPEGTKSYALAVIDIHPVANNWTHWLVINIPSTVDFIPDGASNGKMPAGAVQLKNSFRTPGWGGPQPPRGTGPHTYVFTLYALDSDKLDLLPDAKQADFEKAIKGKVLGVASIKGTYEQ